MPVTLKLEPAPAAVSDLPSTVSTAESLDANEMIIETPAFVPSSLPTVDSQNSEMIGTILAILLCFYVIKFILEFIPKILLVGIGACVVYAFLK